MRRFHCGWVARFGVWLTLGASLAACTGRSTDPGTTPEPGPLIHEPWDNEEAELSALIMSREVGAPYDLYLRVEGDLAAIRARWGDSISQLVQISFSPPYIPGQLLTGVDAATHEAMKNGTYTAWDSLNDLYWIDSIWVRDRYGPILYSSARLNSRMLARVYKDLPGFRWAEPNGLPLDRPNIYGYLHDFGPAYLFRNAWGDCYSGCAYSHFWYFRSVNGEIQFLGDWFQHGDMPRPWWWEEAAKSVSLYHGYEFETRDGGAPGGLDDRQGEL